MIYPLKPVIEEIQTAAEEDGDKRIVKLCNAILKAIHSRPVDNYVAYRKVFCIVNIFSKYVFDTILFYLNPVYFFFVRALVWSVTKRKDSVKMILLWSSWAR